MARQLELAEQLYELIKERMEYDDDIESYISEIHDLNRWNIDLQGFIDNDEEDISAFVIDVENPPPDSMSYAEPGHQATILYFIIWNLMDRLGFSEKTTELIKNLIQKGAKSIQLDVYNKWLEEEEYYRNLQDDWLFSEYNKIKGYLKEMVDREKERVANETQKAYQRLALGKMGDYESIASDNSRYEPTMSQMISELLGEIPRSVDVDRKRELEEILEEILEETVTNEKEDKGKHGGKRKKNKSTAKKSYRKSKKRTSRKPRKQTRKKTRKHRR